MKFTPLARLVMAVALAIGLAACGGSSNTTLDPTVPGPAIAERADVTMRITAAQTAVNAVDDDSTNADVTAADNAVMAASNHGQGRRRHRHRRESRVQHDGTIAGLQSYLAARKSRRQMAMDAAKKPADAAMTLRISIGSDLLASTGDGLRAGACNDNDAINGTIGSAGPVELAEDNKAMAAANHGREGKTYTAEPSRRAGRSMSSTS